MSSYLRSRPNPPIPLLLLKTRSLPHDNYYERFSSSDTVESNIHFTPQFVPVLEHQQNVETLNQLGSLLESGALKERYGGMIFTSQRAVEGWVDIVEKVERTAQRRLSIQDSEAGVSGNKSETRSYTGDTATDSRTGQTFNTDILTTTSFPLYVVGPATARTLSTLLPTLSPRTSPFLSLNPTILGADTGSGAALAPFILKHYNALHAETWLTWHDAPRLPFIPLLGMGSENYSRRRLEGDDPRLQKRPLLFLVGEQRRDIIPKTLMGEGLGKDKVSVEEVEVYSTVVRDGFRKDFEESLAQVNREDDHDKPSAIVVVIFSPQGAGDMLKALGFVDEHNTVTDAAKRRWTENAEQATTKYVVVTIGPTTREYLVNTFGFAPDVCAKKPSPEGVADGLLSFLTEKRLV